MSRGCYHACKCLFTFFLLIVSLCGFVACSYAPIYRPTIQQGNEFEQSAVDQVKLGMTRAEVTQLLGSPLMNAFTNDPNIWHYVYTLERKGKPVQKKYVAVIFSGDHVVQIKR